MMGEVLWGISGENIVKRSVSLDKFSTLTGCDSDVDCIEMSIFSVRLGSSMGDDSGVSDPVNRLSKAKKES